MLPYRVHAQEEVSCDIHACRYFMRCLLLAAVQLARAMNPEGGNNSAGSEFFEQELVVEEGGLGPLEEIRGGSFSNGSDYDEPVHNFGESDILASGSLTLLLPENFLSRKVSSGSSGYTPPYTSLNDSPMVNSGSRKVVFRDVSELSRYSPPVGGFGIYFQDGEEKQLDGGEVLLGDQIVPPPMMHLSSLSSDDMNSPRKPPPMYLGTPYVKRLPKASADDSDDEDDYPLEEEKFPAIDELVDDGILREELAGLDDGQLITGKGNGDMHVVEDSGNKQVIRGVDVVPPLNLRRGGLECFGPCW